MFGSLHPKKTNFDQWFTPFDKTSQQARFTHNQRKQIIISGSHLLF